MCKRVGECFRAGPLCLLGAFAQGIHIDHVIAAMNLSTDSLIYILRESGVLGRLTSGSVERHETEGLRVYDQYGKLNEYISGPRMRSWSVFRGGTPIRGWSNFTTEDERLIAREQKK